MEKANVKVKLITPELAKKYLEKNVSDRQVRQSVVDDFARQMSESKWAPNGNPITFNEDGELVDGHHRLNAIIRANIPVEMVVING